MKMRVLHVGLAMLLAVTSAGARAADVAKTPLEWARQLLAEIKPENTEYRHKEGEVKWAEEGTEAVCRTDCSGFIDAVLKKAYGWDAAYFKKWMGKSRPTAVTYYEAIVAGNGFERITDARKIAAGDVIAIKYPAGSDNTGHVLMADGPAAPRKAAKPEEPGTEQWEIAVMDVSESGHGKTDTRKKEEKGFRQGLGRGIFRLYCGADGSLVGYAWSTEGASVFQGEKERPLAVGRLKTP